MTLGFFLEAFGTVWDTLSQKFTLWDTSSALRIMQTPTYRWATPTHKPTCCGLVSLRGQGAASTPGICPLFLIADLIFFPFPARVALHFTSLGSTFMRGGASTPFIPKNLSETKNWNGCSSE
jgi:hypothetical protein